jgi:hypothetical protein
MQQPGVRTDADAMANNGTVAALHGARAAATGKKRRQWLVTMHAERVWRRTAAECCEGGGVQVANKRGGRTFVRRNEAAREEKGKVGCLQTHAMRRDCRDCRGCCRRCRRCHRCHRCSLDCNHFQTNLHGTTDRPATQHRPALETTATTLDRRRPRMHLQLRAWQAENRDLFRHLVLAARRRQGNTANLEYVDAGCDWHARATGGPHVLRRRRQCMPVIWWQKVSCLQY